MPGQLLHLSDRLLNTPLLIHPAKAQIILGVLSGRIGLDAGLFNDEDGVETPLSVQPAARTDRPRSRVRQTVSPSCRCSIRW